MFQNLFSFEGRIRRMEYGLSLIFYFVIATMINAFLESSQGDGTIVILAYIPALWFLWSQGAKRCHDMGKSGWYQIIPFYVLWMIFQEGQLFPNQNGPNPKAVNNLQYATVTPTPTSTVGCSNEKEDDIIINTISKYDDSVKNRKTNMEVRNVNYGNFQDILRELRSLSFVKSLSSDLVDSIGTITISHDNTSHYLADEFNKITDNKTFIDVNEDSIIIKIN